MPIPIPVSRTKIATVPWGIPITNEVNRLTVMGTRTGATRGTCQASLPNNTYTELTWATTIQDTNGFCTAANVMIVPVGKAGLYAANVLVTTTQANPSSYVSVFMGGGRFDFLSTASGRFIGSLSGIPCAEGSQTYFSIWNGSGIALTPQSSTCYFYRIGA